MKRITVLERTVLERKQRGFFKEVLEREVLIDKTDLFIDKKLKELNARKTRVFEVKNNFNVATKKGINEFLIFLIKNEEWDYQFSNIIRDLQKIKEIIKES